MPRAIRKEVVRVLKGGKICPMKLAEEEQVFYTSNEELEDEEKNIVEELSKIKGVPSYWLVRKWGESEYWLVFECVLKEELEKEILNTLMQHYLYWHSQSPNYGIY